MYPTIDFGKAIIEQRVRNHMAATRRPGTRETR